MKLALILLTLISTLALLCFIGTSIWKLKSNYTISSLVSNIAISIIICVISIPQFIISIKLDYIYYDSILKIILWAFFICTDVCTIKRKLKLVKEISNNNQEQDKINNVN